MLSSRVRCPHTKYVRTGVIYWYQVYEYIYTCFKHSPISCLCLSSSVSVLHLLPFGVFSLRGIRASQLTAAQLCLEQAGLRTWRRLTSLLAFTSSSFYRDAAAAVVAAPGGFFFLPARKASFLKVTPARASIAPWSGRVSRPGPASAWSSPPPSETLF